MSRLMSIPSVAGQTHLMELPAVVKDGELIVPPHTAFLESDGLEKLKSLAKNLGGEVIYWKVRAKIEDLEYATCVKQGCYNKASMLYCGDHDKPRRGFETHSSQPTMLRPVSGS